MAGRKRLKIGTSDYRKFIEENGYFVDKTLFIKEVIDSAHEVMLIPRPRRFGKTLNLSMLRYFFDLMQPDAAKLFEPYLIWQQGEYYTKQQGKYPVIHLSLKAAKSADYDKSVLFIKTILTKVYEQNRYLLENNILSPDERTKFEQILSGEADMASYEFSLKNLCEYLVRHHHQKAVILMDEYDAPIHAGYQHGYYDEVISLMKSLMGNTFKDNEFLHKGVITGILRISRESIFSDLNNLGVYSLLSHTFSDKFGFTEEETAQLLAYFNLQDAFSQVKKWYDGYQVGNKAHIYNPWSIINYIERHTEGFKSYWVNTSSDELIKNQIAAKGAGNIRTNIEQLIKGGVITKSIEENIVFADFVEDRELLWALLVFSGYLIPVKDWQDGSFDLKIPNYEIKTLFKKIVLEWLRREVKIRDHTLRSMALSLANNQISEFKKHFEQLLGDTFSYFDIHTEPERIYQAYVLGLLAILGDDYIIKSNRESGKGRYDILLAPHDASKYGVVIEIKQLDKGASEKQIQQELENALNQIANNQYYKELLAQKVGNRIEMAMIFVGKEVYIDVRN
ncbi:MAG: AAA family ATPase [Lewinellaceae bacterium]|nr:AAA family ATPase [Phaeodactylibacter sp.]MCB9038840.1 AAA family ATPase [Lewinellaceae bacterium]